MQRTSVSAILAASMVTVAASGLGAPPLLRAQSPPGPDEAVKRARDERRLFQDQELITPRTYGFLFNPGDTPRVVWRDVDEVRRLGSDGKLRVRWFDTQLREVEKPDHPGRWAAYVEGTAPNGTPVRRSLTFYARPPGFLLFFFPPEFTVDLPQRTSGIAPEVWAEHREELGRIPRDLLFRAANDSQSAIVLLAGLAESKPLGRPARSTETAAVLDEDFHLAVKLRAQSLEAKVRPLEPPRKRSSPAPVLHDGSPAEAGVRPEMAAKLREICHAWAEDTREPFSVLVARRGVVVLHEAFGQDAQRGPVGLDFRGEVFSITKSITGILFSLFLDQGRLGLDDPVSVVFPGYPEDPAHVPTFRQCFLHMSGLSGHGDWGGMRNPHFENVVLNGIDANVAGKTYEYSGSGYELAVKAMEIASGKSALHLYQDHLFGPLGLGDVPMDLASSGLRPTAWELATLAQWVVNRGSYGAQEFIRPETFAQLMPEPYAKRYPGVPDEGGIGLHWKRPVRTGKPEGSTRPEDLLFGLNTLGHGSLSASLFLADLDNELVVVQIRRAAGERYGEWSSRFLQALAEGLEGPAGAR